jgi:CHAT domain
VSLSQRLVDAADPGTGHLAKVLAARAHALSFAGEFREAVACLDRAAAVARESDNPMDLGVVLLGQVQPLARLGCLSEAEAAARSARACFERAGDIPMLATAPVHLGICLRMLGRPAEALSCFLDAIRSVDEVRGTIRAEQIRAASTESSHDLYGDACSAALDAGPPELVSVLFDIVERMRARTLLDSCAGAVTGSSSVSLPWTALENELHHVYRALGTGAWARSVDESGLRARIDRIESQLEAMNDRAESAGGSGRRAFAPITMEDARASLPGESAVCIFLRDRDHLSAIVLTDRGGVVRPRLAPIAEIERLSRRVRFEVDRFAMMMSRNPEAGGVDPTGSLRRVWNLVLEPLMSECSGRDRIHLVPCKHLHTLPLCDAGVQYDPTGAMYSLTPSVSVDLELARRARESAAEPASSLIVGVADELAPHADEEAKEIANCADRSVMFSGQDASAGTFLSHLSGASLIHLACHCVFEPQFAMSSRVRLADRWVTAREISGRLRRGCTAILAACDSGRGSESGTGEDRFGLLRAFLASGASAVVASLWTLHDETARRLFTDLHRRINRSRTHPAESVTRSLRDAQTELAQQGMPWTLWGAVFAKGAIT